MGQISTGFGSVLTRSTTESSNDRANEKDRIQSGPRRKVEWGVWGFFAPEDPSSGRFPVTDPDYP
jgi:hypothetical protein